MSNKKNVSSLPVVDLSGALRTTDSQGEGTEISVSRWSRRATLVVLLGVIGIVFALIAKSSHQGVPPTHYVVPKNATDASLPELLKSKSLITSLAFAKGSRMTEKGLSALDSLPQLSTLWLGEFSITDVGLEFIGKLTNLNTLIIQDSSQLTETGYSHLASLEKLEILTIANAKTFNGQSLAILARLPSLRGLAIIDNNELQDNDLQVLLEAPQLASLNLTGATKITDTGMETLSALPKIQSLGLIQVPITQQGIAFLRQSKTLQSLQLGSPGIDDACLEELSRMSKFERLSLVGAENVTDDGLEKIASLVGLVSLEIIDCPNITEEGVPKIARFDSLGFLLLKGEQFSDRSLLLLENHARLHQFIIVGKNKMTSSGIQKFKKAIPKCKVEQRKS